MTQLKEAKNVVRAGQVWTSAGKNSVNNGNNYILSKRTNSCRNIEHIEQSAGVGEVPDKICDTFETTYDIIGVNKKVEQMLMNELNSKKKTLALEMELIKSRILKEKKKEDLDHILNNLKDEYDYICTGKKLKEYQHRVKDVLARFSQISGNGRKVVNFISGKEINEDSGSHDLRVSLIFDFVMIAKKFVNISVTKIKKRSTNCEVCGTSLLSFMPDDRSVITCPTCGLEKFYVKDSAYVDTASGSVEVKTKKTKSEYYDITNFKKLVDAYQGKGGSSVNKEQIIKDLDNYFKKNGFPSCQEIKEMKADNLGRRGPFKISRLFEIFSEIGHVEYGENAWLIAHIALGWDLPDLSKYEAKIYSDYQKTQEALNNMTDKDRSSSIGRHYRLFKHMELAGYPCIYENDFKVCRMKDTIRANEELWKKMCESCGDESIYFIPTSYIS